MWQEPYLWWAAFGFALLIVEMLTGTLFCLALAAAAFATTGIAVLTDDQLGQWAGFACASVIALLVWKRLPRKPHEHKTNDAASSLNNRLRHLHGRQAVLTEAIINGSGRINIDDSWWQVTGVDMPAGTHVRVTAVHDMILTVEKTSQE